MFPILLLLLLLILLLLAILFLLLPLLRLFVAVFRTLTRLPIAFELGVLCAMAAGFFGYFVICRMPQLYDPIDGCDSFREASRDGWFVAVRFNDSEGVAQVRAVLDPLGPTSVEEFSE